MDSPWALSKICLALVMGLGLAIIVIVGMPLTQVHSSTPPGLVIAEGHYLVRNGTPFEVRGMNYYPKDYAWDRFWISYTTAITQINTELDLARALGINTVRIFVHYDLFNGSNQSHLDHLKDFVDRLRTRDMVAIVTLFDLYSSPPYSDPVASQRHISAVVNTLGPTNPAVLAWDIKNEIDRDYATFGEGEVKAWATEMISYTRGLDPNHLVTIGFYGAVTGTLCYGPTVTNTLAYSPAIAAEFASAVDFVSMHYFLSERCFESDVQALQSLIGDKPLVLEEFGLHTLAAPAIPCATYPGDPHCDDPHTEIEQAAYYNALLSLSEAYDLAGYLFWTLTDFSYILPDSQESHHCQGILRNRLVDVCQVATTFSYAEKPAADTVRRHYDNRVAYLDLFDGWIVPDTDEPPPGWSDNWSQGGALLRGYSPSQLLWSHDPGKVAFSKFVTNGTSITGLAGSPALKDVNVDRYPLLSGQVSSYSTRDITYGSHSTLYVGVKDGTQITQLLTITPDATLPYTFNLDLRRPPAGWSGIRNFQIVLQLVPEDGGDGYSAAYELDWVAIRGYEMIYLPLILKESSL
jgi:hypothetical protein